jgi:two-component system, OmpR family, phosphate regulon sensor histidine kinase PhoR
MELDVFKKDLINHVTHEFRTPLNAIASAAEIIAACRPEERGKAADYLKMINSNVDRLTHFVDELLELAVIQQAKVRLNLVEADLLLMAEKIISRLKPLAEKSGVEMSLEGAPLICVCDEDKIEQVIGNLIANAIKAAPAGRVVVSIMRDGQRVCVSIADNGVGIAPEHLPHIFSSFYRIAIKKSAQKGSGLGLAIAKGWIEAHGGKIWAESEGLGKGAKIIFTLPI